MAIVLGRTLAYASLALIAGTGTRALAEHIISSAFVASLTSGSLAGTTFPVFFSYDADQVSAQGDSFIALTSFDFALGGVSFARNDIFQGGQVIFHNGSLEDITASFQVRLPPNSPVNNITFGFGGNGVIGYLDLQNQYGSGTFQVVAVTTILNAASFAIGHEVSPGSLATLFGSGLAFQKAHADSIPLPTTIGKVSVSIDGTPAPLLYVSPTQINLQIPWNVPTGTADVTVAFNGRPLASFRGSIGPLSPGIFTLQYGIGQAIAINQDGSLAAPEGSIPGLSSHPAKPGDPLMILATGLGAVIPMLPSGTVPNDGLRTTNARPNVFIGGIPAEVTFSGLAPQFVGVNQINVVVPSVPAGMAPLQIEAGGTRTTNRVTMSVGTQ
jgi:uncharacterized protein (TIGR03437 family)